MQNVVMPKIYSEDELRELSRAGVESFVEERHDAEMRLSNHYHECFDEAYDAISGILERTDNLFSFKEDGKSLLVEGNLSLMRAMTRPTVSEDDFKNLSGTGTAAASKFGDDHFSEPALEYLSRNLNDDIFSWMKDGSQPTDEQLDAACVAVAALIADQKTKTLMRSSSSSAQESYARETLSEQCGLKFVDARDFIMASQGPKPGEIFSVEAKVAGTKADVVLGLFDGRIMCLECKVSNSEVNSFKRLNHEVVDKVAKWRDAFGFQCVSGGILKGCYKTSNLQSAQEAGAFLFWSSDLSDLVSFINSTKSAS